MSINNARWAGCKMSNCNNYRCEDCGVYFRQTINELKSNYKLLYADYCALNDLLQSKRKLPTGNLLERAYWDFDNMRKTKRINERSCFKKIVKNIWRLKNEQN